MAHWKSRAFNKVLERVMRQRMARCNDVHEMRELITNIDQYGALVNAPKLIERSPCSWLIFPASGLICQNLTTTCCYSISMAAVSVLSVRTLTVASLGGFVRRSVPAA